MPREGIPYALSELRENESTVTSFTATWPSRPNPNGLPNVFRVFSHFQELKLYFKKNNALVRKRLISQPTNEEGGKNKQFNSLWKYILFFL